MSIDDKTYRSFPGYIQDFTLEILDRLLACTVETANGQQGVPAALVGRYIQRVIDSLVQVDQSILPALPSDTIQDGRDFAPTAHAQPLPQISQAQPVANHVDGAGLGSQQTGLEAQYWYVYCLLVSWAGNRVNSSLGPRSSPRLLNRCSGRCDSESTQYTYIQVRGMMRLLPLDER